MSARAEEHWAYVPPVDSKPPAGEANPVDAYLLAAQKKSNLTSAPLADAKTWVKRATYALTGLPPTAEQLKKLSDNPTDEQWRALIDELLAQPAYGERWARHWMDVARYSDTLGYNFDKDNRYPYAYTYRDWLIKAFNEDMPYPKFVKLQLAADLICDQKDDPDLAALGFLTVGRRSGNLETNDDRVDVITRGFMSTTVACARCHDHKTDPITTEDYYSIYSILDNLKVPSEGPVIGQPADNPDYEDYRNKLAELDAKNSKARQDIIDQVRLPETSATYLELAWLSIHNDWDSGKISSEAFKRGRFRLNVVSLWKKFLKEHAESPALAAWMQEMESTPADQLGTTALKLAEEWANASSDSELGKLAVNHACPLSIGMDRVGEIMDQKDNNDNNARTSARSKLQTEHPGSPPRAMVVADKDKYSSARVFVRGNPSNPGEPFKRHWLSFLGGEPFPEGQSPRLSLAEKIADPANPLTSRVIVNRVWAWDFGHPLADPADFGPQQPTPPLLPLLDWLTLRFDESGGSIKELQRIILSSKAFRLASTGPAANSAADEANSLFWKWSTHRVDFEAMRDRLLMTSGSLDLTKIGGRSVRIDKKESDSRRSVYAFIDRYALPSTFISFDLPHPDQHAAARVETTVPQQALYFLNSPFVIRQAESLANAPDFAKIQNDQDRITWLYQRIFEREPRADEKQLVGNWISTSDPTTRWADLIQMLWSSNEFHYID
ncbi:DUF1549 domain-containing protein [Luteolibacter pohnpeiensis]|uniref:DUF1549 domain-containing protein n=2 Tax=Luteolibacter pohnpeiensis TaxID=454153 RepID=A0A934S434_9BACT|nr:DUF1549 domain-containing protein [Luteolibacter pohnpeiensis]